MQKRLKRFWEKVVASILVVLLTAGNLMLIGNSLVSYAGENLEAQNEQTSHQNVEFGAYFISEGREVHSLVSDAQAQPKLYIHLNVKNAGYFSVGKIELQGANYVLAGELEKSEIIGSIDGNVIGLKQLAYGTEALLEIPVKLEIEDKFKVDNISKDSNVVLTGTYVTNEGEEVNIEKKVTLNLTWEGTSDISLRSEVVTYQTYEDGVILVEKIEAENTKNSLPIRKTIVEVKVPTLNGSKPKAVKANSNRLEMTNGKTLEEVNLNWNYNKETGIVTIETENEEVNKEVYLVSSGKDEYILTYEYDEVPVDEANVKREATVTVKNYGDNEESAVTKTITKEDTLAENIGGIVNGEIIINEEINKAKMYANYNSNRREYETEYTVKEIVNTVKADLVEGVTIESVDEAFVSDNEEEYSTKIGDVNYTYYKETKIAETNFKKILGTDGTITIENTLGEEIAKIDNSTKIVEGQYIVTYNTKPEEIVIKTSKPVTDGNLIIEHEKAIKSDLGYSKEDVEGFKKIVTKAKVGDVTKIARTTIEGEQNLVEAVNNLKVESNKEAINKTEEEIEIKVEFGNNEEDSILYNEPTVMITLPEFVEDVEVLNTNLLFEDELEVVKAEAGTINGNKAISVKLEGTQTKFSSVSNGNGTTLVLGAKLTNKQESGEGEIIAKVGKNAAKTSITSNLKAPAEQATEAIVPTVQATTTQVTTSDTTTNNNETTTGTEAINNEETEEQEKPRIELEMISNVENEDVEEEERVYYTVFVKNVSDYLTTGYLGVSIDWHGLETDELRSLLTRWLEIIEDQSYPQIDVESLSSEELEDELSKAFEELCNEGYYQGQPEEIKNIIVKDFIPSGVTYEKAAIELYNEETGEYEEAEGKVAYDAKNRVVTWNVGDMFAQPQAKLTLDVKTNDLGNGETIKEIENTVSATYSEYNDTITSNTVKFNVVKGNLSITKQTENVKESNKVGERVKLIVKIKNTGKLATEFYNISGELPKEFLPEEMTWGKVENTETLQTVPRRLDILIPSLEPEEEFVFELTGRLDLDVNYKENYKEVPVELTINGEKISWTIKIENSEVVDPDNPDSTGVPENPTGPIIPPADDENTENAESGGENANGENNNSETPDNPSDSETENDSNNPGTSGNNSEDNNSSETQKKIYTVSGIAWLDENKDGIKEEGEKLLENIEVKLVKGKTEIAATKTDKNGKYIFNNVEAGEYQVIFSFDGNTYRVAEYRKTGELEINSSAIAGDSGEALTDVISVEKDIQHMNLGLTKIPEFDFSLTKQVSRIIVQNSEGTKTYDFDNDYAKVDINAKYINGSVVLVEYKIIIKNEGELAGRVKKVIDYMPRDMVFSTDLNRTWVQDSNGNLTNSELKDLNIEPGETKELTLILRRNMTEDNVGLINNTAEIAEIENDENIKDKDSTPGNRVNGEDDMSVANVLLGVRTGSEVMYITLAIVVLVILTTGIYVINKKVLKG